MPHPRRYPPGSYPDLAPEREVSEFTYDPSADDRRPFRCGGYPKSVDRLPGRHGASHAFRCSDVYVHPVANGSFASERGRERVTERDCAPTRCRDHVDACLDLFAGLQARPAHMFNYWHLASTLRSRVPSIGVLAAKRGLELAAHRGKPAGFDLRKLIDEGERGVDTMEPSPRALREALRRDFDAPREGLVETAHRLVPELATTRVKELPPMPEPAELVVIGRRLRPVVDELERRETLLAGSIAARMPRTNKPLCTHHCHLAKAS